MLHAAVAIGAFIAGVILELVDGDRMMTHPQFRQKLEAIGFGVFILIFFVTNGLQFDLPALFASPTTILRVPIFLAALQRDAMTSLESRSSQERCLLATKWL